MTRMRYPRAIATIALISGAALVLGPLPAPGSESARVAGFVDVTLDPTVRFYRSEVTPGEDFYVWGGDWLPPNCNSKIHLKLEDSGGRNFSLGRFRPVNPKIVYEGQEYPAALEASPTVPDGARPGRAKVWGKQDWAFRFPVFGCFDVAQITSKKRSITILGESGNDPPRITGFQILNLAQGGPGSIRWSASEPCAATVNAQYRLAPGVRHDLPPILTDHPSAAGENAVSYDATSQGRALPTGEYRAFIQCTEANGAKSAIARDTFFVEFGR